MNTVSKIAFAFASMSPEVMSLAMRGIINRQNPREPVGEAFDALAKHDLFSGSQKEKFVECFLRNYSAVDAGTFHSGAIGAEAASWYKEKVLKTLDQVVENLGEDISLTYQGRWKSCLKALSDSTEADDHLRIFTELMFVDVDLQNFKSYGMARGPRREQITEQMQSTLRKLEIVVLNGDVDGFKYLINPDRSEQEAWTNMQRIRLGNGLRLSEHCNITNEEDCAAFVADHPAYLFNELFAKHYEQMTVEPEMENIEEEEEVEEQEPVIEQVEDDQEEEVVEEEDEDVPSCESESTAREEVRPSKNVTLKQKETRVVQRKQTPKKTEKTLRKKEKTLKKKTQTRKCRCCRKYCPCC